MNLPAAPRRGIVSAAPFTRFVLLRGNGDGPFPGTVNLAAEARDPRTNDLLFPRRSLEGPVVLPAGWPLFIKQGEVSILWLWN
jgi:hypothetical protein